MLLLIKVYMNAWYNHNNHFIEILLSSGLNLQCYVITLISRLESPSFPRVQDINHLKNKTVKELSLFHWGDFLALFLPESRECDEGREVGASRESWPIYWVSLPLHSREPPQRVQWEGSTGSQRSPPFKSFGSSSSPSSIRMTYFLAIANNL